MSSPLGPGKRLKIDGQRQAGNLWCWLATASMVEDFETAGPAISQCKLASRYFNVLTACGSDGRALSLYDRGRTFLDGMGLVGLAYRSVGITKPDDALVERIVRSLEHDDLVALRAAYSDKKKGGHLVVVPEAYMSGHFVFWDSIQGASLTSHFDESPSKAMGGLEKWTHAYFMEEA